MFSIWRGEEGEERAEDGDGRAQQDAERQRPAFILGGEDQEDAQQRQAEDGTGRNALRGFLFLEGHAEIIEAHLGRHGLGEDLLQRLVGLVGAVAGRGAAVDLRAAVFIVVHDELRPGAAFAPSVKAESGTLSPLIVAHVEQADVLGASRGIRLRPRHRPAIGGRSG